MSVQFINSFLGGGGVAGGTLANPKNRFLFEYYGVGSGTQSVGIDVDNDGKLYKTTFTAGPKYLEKWLLAGDPAAFEVRATVLSGIAPLGQPVGTWLSCDFDRAWYIQRSTVGISRSEILIEWRDAVTLTILEEATIDMTLEYGT